VTIFVFETVCELVSVESNTVLDHLLSLHCLHPVPVVSGWLSHNTGPAWLSPVQLR